MNQAVSMLMALAALLLVAVPLHAHVAVWSWSFMMLAAVIAWRTGTRGQTSHPLSRALWVWVAWALSACLIDLLMGLWHGEPLRTMRQDGKLLIAGLFTAVLWNVLQRQSSGSGTSGAAGTASMNVTTGLTWPTPGIWPAALALQMVVAAWVALSWPRADLPPSPLPWATSVALGLAVLAPMLGHRSPPGQRLQVALVALLAVAIVAGIVAVVGSRSRSAWVILPWLMVVAVAGARHRWRAAGLTLAVAGLALAAVVHHEAQLPIQVERGLRVLDLWDELMRLGHPDASTSTGSRVLMWEAAWHSLLQHPWVGIGQQARIELVQQVVPPHLTVDIEPLVHVHQQFLNQAVDHGLPGLVAACLSAGAVAAMAWTVPAGMLRWQLAGVAVVHIGGLLFNANMTHGPYAFALSMAVTAAVLMHAGGPTRTAAA